MRVPLISLIAALTACDAILGIEDLPRRSDFVKETRECRTCSEESCGTARDKCLGDPLCRDLYACIATCASSEVGGPLCRRRCESGSTASKGAPFRALDACRRINCSDECYGFTGFGQTVDPRCSCSDSVCEPFIRRCVRSGELREGEQVGACERRFACLASRATPLDPDDAVGCTYEERGGQEELQLVRFCWQGAACGTCPVASGKMFDCRERYQWSRPQPNEVPFSLTINDRLGRPLANTIVDACGIADCDACANPLDSKTTGADGTARLNISTFGGGFRGCFQVRAPGKMPTLWFLGRPLTREEWLQGVVAFSEQEITQITAEVGVKPDFVNRGQLMVGARDCIFTPASGVTFDPPTAEGAFGLYIRGTETTREGPTDDTGQAAFGNLLPGSFTVAMRNKSGELGRATARIRAGWVSGIFVFPSPIPDGSL